MDGTDSTRGGAAVRGALVGLLLVVPVTLVTAIGVDTGTDEVSGWRIPMFFLLLVAFGIAGGVAGHEVHEARYTVGVLAGLGTFALWLPVRSAIWALRDDDRGLVSGADAVLGPGQLFTAALFAAALGLVGGVIGGGRAARRADPEA